MTDDCLDDIVAGLDRFLEMRAFVAVVNAGRFVRATDTLNVSKTAVSRLVADLESRLGTRLLQRTTRKLSLTQEGEVFQERCKGLLDGLEEAEAELNVHTGRSHWSAARQRARDLRTVAARAAVAALHGRAPEGDS
jgi:DNA-binding transcriptional LysR family regulator